MQIGCIFSLARLANPFLQRRKIKYPYCVFALLPGSLVESPALLTGSLFAAVTA
jgi:hypothetical protein